eukprot:TRINITY_DN5432_c0_g2_i1.p1 TRINITY_DN5432_c0_g2~~TRINITY_DN5432_c0_g2_i1.p1  ORF type:complete len:590 (+),score=110.04 TRINITY_DN5432_c0_g2_i1:76-1845(+)
MYAACAAAPHGGFLLQVAADLPHGVKENLLLQFAEAPSLARLRRVTEDAYSAELQRHTAGLSFAVESLALHDPAKGCWAPLVCATQLAPGMQLFAFQPREAGGGAELPGPIPAARPPLEDWAHFAAVRPDLAAALSRPAPPPPPLPPQQQQQQQQAAPAPQPAASARSDSPAALRRQRQHEAAARLASPRPARCAVKRPTASAKPAWLPGGRVQQRQQPAPQKKQQAPRSPAGQRTPRASPEPSPVTTASRSTSPPRACDACGCRGAAPPAPWRDLYPPPPYHATPGAERESAARSPAREPRPPPAWRLGEDAAAAVRSASPSPAAPRPDPPAHSPRAAAAAAVAAAAAALPPPQPHLLAPQRSAAHLAHRAPLCPPPAAVPATQPPTPAGATYRDIRELIPSPRGGNAIPPPRRVANDALASAAAAAAALRMTAPQLSRTELFASRPAAPPQQWPQARPELPVSPQRPSAASLRPTASPCAPPPLEYPPATPHADGSATTAVHHCAAPPLAGPCGASSQPPPASGAPAAATPAAGARPVDWPLAAGMRWNPSLLSPAVAAGGRSRSPVRSEAADPAGGPAGPSGGAEY